MKLCMTPRRLAAACCLVCLSLNDLRHRQHTDVEYGMDVKSYEACEALCNGLWSPLAVCCTPDTWDGLGHQFHCCANS